MAKTLYPTPGIEAWAVLLRSGRLALDAVQAALKAQGFPPLEWYDVLLELKQAPERMLRPTDLAERLLLGRYNVTRLIDRMSADGLVAREACEEDARSQWVVLTEHGAALQKRMWPAYRAAIASYFSDHLGETEAERLTASLRKIVDANTE